MGAVILVVQPEFLSMSPVDEALQSVPNPNHRALGFICVTIGMFLSAGDGTWIHHHCGQTGYSAESA
jgi:hypothetical protein